MKFFGSARGFFGSRPSLLKVNLLRAKSTVSAHTEFLIEFCEITTLVRGRGALLHDLILIISVSPKSYMPITHLFAHGLPLQRLQNNSKPLKA